MPCSKFVYHLFLQNNRSIESMGFDDVWVVSEIMGVLQLLLKVQSAGALFGHRFHHHQFVGLRIASQLGCAICSTSYLLLDLKCLAQRCIAPAWHRNVLRRWYWWRRSSRNRHSYVPGVTAAMRDFLSSNTTGENTSARNTKEKLECWLLFHIKV